MKAPPFKSSNHKDPNYSLFMQENKENFWKLFSSCSDPTPQFKGTNAMIIDLIQGLFDENPKTRISLQNLKKHPWYTKEIPKKNEYKKQMNMRLKKVWSKVRKEQ